MRKTLSELGQFSIRVLEHWNSVGSESLSYYFEGCKLCRVRLGKGKISKGGGVVRKERSNIKRDRTPLLTMPPTSNHYEETGYFASLSGLVLFYRRWKDEEKEPWNPCLGSRYSNFEVQASNIFNENYSNSNIFNGPGVESVFHSRDHPIIPIPFLFFFNENI